MCLHMYIAYIILRAYVRHMRVRHIVIAQIYICVFGVLRAAAYNSHKHCQRPSYTLHTLSTKNLNLYNNIITLNANFKINI